MIKWSCLEKSSKTHSYVTDFINHFFFLFFQSPVVNLTSVWWWIQLKVSNKRTSTNWRQFWKTSCNNSIYIKRWSPHSPRDIRWQKRNPQSFWRTKIFWKKLSYKSDRRKNRQTDKTYASRFGIGEGRLRTIHQGKWRQTWRAKCYGFFHRRKVSPKGDGEKKVQGTFEKY